MRVIERKKNQWVMYLVEKPRELSIDKQTWLTRWQFEVGKLAVHGESGTTI